MIVYYTVNKFKRQLLIPGKAENIQERKLNYGRLLSLTINIIYTTTIMQTLNINLTKIVTHMQRIGDGMFVSANVCMYVCVCVCCGGRETERER